MIALLYVFTGMTRRESRLFLQCQLSQDGNIHQPIQPFHRVLGAYHPGKFPGNSDTPIRHRRLLVGNLYAP